MMRYGRLIGIMAALFATAPAFAMDVVEQDGRLIVTGANFRYTWDTRRGGELAVVEQQSDGKGGWWMRGGPRQTPSRWHRVSSTFAWKSLDTIPAISFSTKRGAYYSGEWNICWANADNKAEIKVLKKSADEVSFETTSHPKILENRRLPIPWVIKQNWRVFDSGVIVLDLEAQLPKDEVYELDWAQMGFNLDDSLYKEPHPDKQALFTYAWGFPGEDKLSHFNWKNVIQSMDHLPLDIDLKTDQRVTTGNKPMLFTTAAYELTHIKGSPWNAFAECSLEDARSIVGTKEDFGSTLMQRPASGMSPVPTWAGSMRNQPCFGLMWNLFDGRTRGLNEPLVWRNRMVMSFAQRKRSNRPDATGDDRNVLMASRVYFARDKMPSAAEVKAMAAEGADTLVLGAAWKADAAGTAAAVQAAHESNMRVGAVIDARQIKSLLADTSWFTKVFQKDRDGLFVTNISFLSSQMPEGDIDACGIKATFAKSGDTMIAAPAGGGPGQPATGESVPVSTHSNALAMAASMRALRGLVGAKGFLIGQDDAPGATLLGMAECDVYCPKKADEYQWGGPVDRFLKRGRAGGAGLGVLADSVSPQTAGLAAMQGDTPIVVWPAKDTLHQAWWNLTKKLPAGRSELSLLPHERRFSTSNESVQGMLIVGDGNKATLLLTADKAGAAKVTFTVPVESVKALDGAAVPVAANAFDTGDFAPWQIKAYEVVLVPAVPATKPAGP